MNNNNLASSRVRNMKVLKFYHRRKHTDTHRRDISTLRAPASHFRLQ